METDTALQARLTDFSDYRTSADIELTHLGTLKTLLSEVLLLANEQRQARTELQLVLNHLRQGFPEEAVNPPPSSSHERIIAKGSLVHISLIRELQATVTSLVDEVVILRSVLQESADAKMLHNASALHLACDRIDVPENRAATNSAMQKKNPDVPLKDNSFVLGRTLQQFGSLDSDVSIARKAKNKQVQGLNSFVLLENKNSVSGDSPSSGKLHIQNQEIISMTLSAVPAETQEIPSPRGSSDSPSSGKLHSQDQEKRSMTLSAEAADTPQKPPSPTSVTMSKPTRWRSLSCTVVDPNSQHNSSSGRMGHVWRRSGPHGKFMLCPPSSAEGLKAEKDSELQVSFCFTEAPDSSHSDSTL